MYEGYEPKQYVLYEFKDLGASSNKRVTLKYQQVGKGHFVVKDYLGHAYNSVEDSFEDVDVGNVIFSSEEECREYCSWLGTTHVLLQV